MKRLEFLLKYWKTMTVCSELNFACRYKSVQPSQFGSDSKNIIVLEKNLKLRPLSIAFVLDVLRFSGCFAQIFPRRLYRRSRRIFPRSIQRSIEKINEFSRKISSFATWTFLFWAELPHSHHFCRIVYSRPGLAIIAISTQSCHKICDGTWPWRRRNANSIQYVYFILICLRAYVLKSFRNCAIYLNFKIFIFIYTTVKNKKKNNSTGRCWISS